VNVGLWSAPAVLAGLFVILWGATWLERFVAPPGLDAKPEMAEAANTEPTGPPATTEVFSVDGALTADLAITTP
jgi:hypothetical protein